MFHIKATLVFYSNLSAFEISDLLVPEAERYIEFYAETESERIQELIKVFSVYNAESTAAGNAISNSKRGSAILKKYADDMKTRFLKEDENLDHIESQFEVLNGKQD